jgi:hypothetical protein
MLEKDGQELIRILENGRMGYRRGRQFRVIDLADGGWDTGGGDSFELLILRTVGGIQEGETVSSY